MFDQLPFQTNKPFASEICSYMISVKNTPTVRIGIECNMTNCSWFFFLFSTGFKTTFPQNLHDEIDLRDPRLIKYPLFVQASAL